MLEKNLDGKQITKDASVFYFRWYNTV